MSMAEATSSLTRRTAAGMASTTTAMILTAVFQVIYTVVMARLLTPREFGLVAMANVVIGLTAQLSRFGVGPALIQHPRLDDALIRSATALSWAFGAIGTVVILALAPLAGWFFEEPAVVPVLMALAVAVTIAAVALVPEALLRRALRFQWLAGIDVTSHAIGYLGVGIIAASMGAGVWSLVAATLSQAVLKALAMLLVERRGLRPGWSRQAVRRIASFGSQVTAIGLMYYVVTSLPTVVIGRVLGSASLGQYNRADLLIRLPIDRLTNSISHVLFPALATVNLETRRFLAGYSIAAGGAAALILPTAGFVALMAGPIVTALLGPGWEPAAAVLPIISIAAAVSYLTRLFGVSLEALGRLKGKLVTGIVVLALSAVLMPIAARFGLRAVAGVVVGVELIRFGILSTLLSRVEGCSMRAVLLPLLSGTLLASAVVGMVLPLRLLDPDWSPLTFLVAAALASIAGVALAQLLPPVAALRRALLLRLRLARVSPAESIERQPPDSVDAPFERL
jgi:lipopolysaccharide exporter